MNAKSVRFVLTLTAGLVLTANLSFAGSWFGRSSTKSIDVDLASVTKLSDGTVLEPGNYTIKIPEHTQSPQVQFYRDRQLVARVQAKVETQPH